jgi:hypothetical protein
MKEPSTLGTPSNDQIQQKIPGHSMNNHEQPLPDVYKDALGELIDLLSTKPNYGSLTLQLLFHDGKYVRFVIKTESAHQVN